MRVSERPNFSDQLDSAVDVVLAPARVDFRAGEVAPTGRDLDFALEGPGFFQIESPGGTRYTRNGHFTRRADGALATPEGEAVLSGGVPLIMPAGEVKIATDGTVKVAGKSVGQIDIAEFPDTSRLIREDGVRFRTPAGLNPEPAETTTVRSGLLEGSNVSLPERIVQMTEISRGFDALQRGISVLMNDIDGRAISDLGRR